MNAPDEAEESVGSGDAQKLKEDGNEHLRIFASSPETADLTALSAEVQAIAHRFNEEFEAVLTATSGSPEFTEAGSAIVQRLLPTVVAVLEQLDEFYKDHAAYKAEVVQLREENASLVDQLAKAKAARRDTEEVGKLTTRNAYLLLNYTLKYLNWGTEVEEMHC